MKKLIVALMVVGAGFMGLGCEKEPETPGEKLENAMEEAGEAMGDAVDDAAEKVEEVVEEAKE